MNEFYRHSGPQPHTIVFRDEEDEAERANPKARQSSDMANEERESSLGNASIRVRVYIYIFSSFDLPLPLRGRELGKDRVGRERELAIFRELVIFDSTQPPPFNSVSSRN